jgi:hypothetical protein
MPTVQGTERIPSPPVGVDSLAEFKPLFPEDSLFFEHIAADLDLFIYLSPNSAE